MSEESTSAEQRPNITLQDIASVVEILRVVTERGVWKVNELTVVGQLYDRLVNFLEGAGVEVKKPMADQGEES
jgi:hypothetical protein